MDSNLRFRELQRRVCCEPDALDQVDFGLLLRWLERLLCALLRALLAASPPAQIA
jgi:hypothetical protein